MTKLRLFLVAVAVTVFQPLEARVTGLPDFTELVAEAGPAVVNIRTTEYGQTMRGRGGDDDAQAPFEGDVPDAFRRFFQGPNGPRPDRRGAGSGFIIDSTGYVVTNHHVIDGADQIIVRLADRREFEAELIGSDAPSDIALLKIDAFNLPTLDFGDAESLKPGEWVMAIGSPFNLDQTVTAGIVSATGRSSNNDSQRYVPFIQTDVAINQGNSGGPLLNMDGEVVGVNSWILTSGGGYIGLSFSIPSELVQSTVSQLRENGRVERGLLGVQVGPVTREIAEAMDLDRVIGALVNSVSEGSAAERAGIEAGDIIVAFDEQPVNTWNDLPPLVGANPPGFSAEVLVSRAGEERAFEVVLDALEPVEEDLMAANDEAEAMSNAIGLAVEGVSGELRRELDAPEGGVVVASVESDAAWRSGIRPGDIIISINNEPVEGLEAFGELVDSLEPGKAVALRVWREGTTSFLAFTPTEDEVG